ncbi:DUF3533 domain-containing protein [Streptomyces sp. NPDC020951]|uniref:YhgE/Pip domain-containing protein n=1 Tax=Streptomyces sp. NPDC020951 TaxID=3365104 RepID=UPI0037B53B85
MPSTPTDHPASVTAVRLLRTPKLWLPPAVVLTIALTLITLLFNGSIANPGADLRDAPIGLVSLDKGATTGQATNLNIGHKVVEGIAARPQKPHKQVEWKTFTSMADAKKAIGRNELFSAVVLPQDYSAKMLGLMGTHPEKPEVTILTNHGSGAMAASIGEKIATNAVRAASSGAAEGALQQSLKAGAEVPAANQALLKDPITVASAPGAPLGERTGMGMTAFFYAILLMLSGFLGANLLHAALDGSLGYSPNELGPKRHVVAPQRINRRQTLLAKCLMMVGVAPILSATILAMSTWALHLDLPNSLTLWLFSTAAIAAVGIGALAMLAVLGGPGVLIGVIFFIAASIPTSGGAIPLNAMPPFWRFLAMFEPQRAFTDGVRAIIYFDGQGAAGLDRAWTTIGVGTLTALVVGFGMTWLYDHKGWHRIHPHALTRLRHFLHREHEAAHAEATATA